MKKAHILKKQEARFWKRMGPVTEENMDTYPIGNPYKESSKSDIEELKEFIKRHREENPLSEDTKKELDEMCERLRKENAEAEVIRERKRIRKIFIK